MSSNTKSGARTLHLTLEKKWFEMTKSGQKTEDYREIKPYWVSRLCDRHDGAIGGDLMDRHKVRSFTFKKFTHTRLVNGYGTDKPVIVTENLGISIGRGRPEWGAPEDEDVFIIKHGRITATGNIK